MSTRKKIARAAAKAAALATYKAVLTAPTKKVATSVGVSRSLPTVAEVAKMAAVATYKAIQKIAQVEMSFPEPDPMTAQGIASRFGLHALISYMNQQTPPDQKEMLKPEAQNEVVKFIEQFPDYAASKGMNPNIINNHLNTYKQIFINSGLVVPTGSMI